MAQNQDIKQQPMSHPNTAGSNNQEDDLFTANQSIVGQNDVHGEIVDYLLQSDAEDIDNKG